MREPTFERALASYVLGFLASDDLPLVAARALEAGMSSRSLGMLAGELASTHPADLRALFEAAVAELGILLPSRVELATSLKRAFAADYCAGIMDPEDAARAILDLHDAIRNEVPTGRLACEDFDVVELVGAYWSLDDEYSREPALRTLDSELRRIAGETD